MNTYGWLLLGQTLLALLALGACGGWLLRPFVRAERPFLWLAAPLAGLFTFGGALALSYFLVGLPFRWALWVALLANAGGTVLVLVRSRPARSRLGSVAVGCLVALVAAYWGTFACNRASIDAREPALAVIDGSDMFGYSLVADWMVAHRAAEGPSATDELDGLARYNLRVECSRPNTFALLGAAAEALGTSGRFAYDWAAGVILAAALVGFAGAFAGGPWALAALVAGAALSCWLTNARTGYMGKSVGYPGGLLLAELFRAALAEPSRARWGAVAVLTAALAWALSPTFPAALFAIVLGGYAVAPVAVFARGSGESDEPRPGFWRAVARPFFGACARAALVSVPWLVLHKLVFGTFNPPLPPADWDWVLPAALDLELPTLKSVPMRGPLLWAAAALGLLGLLAATVRRDRSACALLACALFAPFCWAVGEFRVYTFHGLLYPLALAGCAALAAGARGSAAWAAIALALLSATAAARVPQARAAAERYVVRPPSALIFRASEARALREAVGSDDVDVALAHWADCHFAWAELAAHGVPVRFRSPGRNVSVGAYAPPHRRAEPTDPKARLALVERGAWAAGTVRWTGKRLKLVENRDEFALVGGSWPLVATWDAQWRPGAWLGTEPVAFRIHNGNGTERAVRFVADAPPEPARTLVYRTDRAGGSVQTSAAVAVPLRLAPGWNRVELSVAPPAPSDPSDPTRLLHFTNWRIEAEK